MKSPAGEVIETFAMSEVGAMAIASNYPSNYTSHNKSSGKATVTVPNAVKIAQSSAPTQTACERDVCGSDVVLTYEFFQIPDSLEMFYDGNTIFSVGPALGSEQKTFRLPASAQQVGITLRGNNDPDTRWWYVVSCDPTNVANPPTAPSMPE